MSSLKRHDHLHIYSGHHRNSDARDLVNPLDTVPI